jgi:glycosyltransferase involved in cell wall biosynthesis
MASTIPQISVILPFRDASYTLRRSIGSILEQNFQDFELVLVDDGSTDDSAQIAESFLDDRIRHVRLNPQGLVGALNEGFYASNGKYVARMDADDYSHPDRLKKQLEYFQANLEYGVVSCLINYKGDKEKNLGYYNYVQWTNEVITHEDMYLKRFMESPLAHPSVMVKRDLIKIYGEYKDGEFPEDYELWLRLMEKGVKFGKVPEYLLDWYDDDNRLSRRHKKYSMEAFYHVKAEYFSNWYKSYFSSNPPQIIVWGTGKSVKQKSKYLEDFDLDIAGYIDVIDKPDHWFNGRPVFYYKDIPERVFILSFVGDREGKKMIFEHLISNGYVEGRNFYFMT